MKMEPLQIEGSQEIDFSTNDSQSFFSRISLRILNQKKNSNSTAGILYLKRQKMNFFVRALSFHNDLSPMIAEWRFDSANDHYQEYQLDAKMTKTGAFSVIALSQRLMSGIWN
ncbi:MAG: hypothetical protein V7676_17090 [Parasphingorhabdus sp.]|uniref:hypothetical protein n=1 Tax=Parasphingorhabdus sp. TaxID=2709688 RepID=UPI003001774A